MSNGPLEKVAYEHNNVVLYDDIGNPSIFVPFHKMKSSDLDSRLPEHTHPAFVVNGEEKDMALIGKYKGVNLSGRMYSLPNMPLWDNVSLDTALTAMRQTGNRVTGLTVADYGLIILMAAKYGWDPKGNNNYGCDHRDIGAWAHTAGAISLGRQMSFRGWAYECIKQHTASADLRPDKAPDYWKRCEKAGGTVVPGVYGESTYYQGTHVLNGSGPLSWYPNHDPAGLSDLNGGANEMIFGIRLYDLEIQVLPDNNAADPEADMSENSKAWRAILPHAADAGHDLVEPGTPGTLHYTWDGSTIVIDTVKPTTMTGSTEYVVPFNDVTVNPEHIPVVPAILYEYGLIPLPGTNLRGSVYLKLIAGDLTVRRGGSYRYRNTAGIATYRVDVRRTSVGDNHCARPRSWMNEGE